MAAATVLMLTVICSVAAAMEVMLALISSVAEATVVACRVVSSAPLLSCVAVADNCVEAAFRAAGITGDIGDERAEFADETR